MVNHTEDINVEITEKKVRSMLYAIKTDKSPGPDGIHPLFLQNTVEEVAGPITLIFKKSLAEGILPHECGTTGKGPIFHLYIVLGTIFWLHTYCQYSVTYLMFTARGIGIFSVVKLCFR